MRNRRPNADRLDNGALIHKESAKAASLVNPTQHTAFQTQLQELVTFIIVLLQYLAHPIAAIQTQYPDFFNMCGSAPAFMPDQSIPSLQDKVILVTGGNVGLGKETILQLAKHNPAKIYLASRTESKARDAIRSINEQLSTKANVEYLPLDLSSLKSVEAAANHVNASSERLDVLILNAGIMAMPYSKTDCGHDIQLGTNHIGHFTLTKLLLPLLEKSAAGPGGDVRIISLASEANQMAPGIDTIVSNEKLAKKGNWTRYGASKAANILFAAEMARRYPAFKSVSLHPGIIKTDLWKSNSENGGVVGFVLGVAEHFGKSVQEGALNTLWCAAGAKRDELQNGAYYTPVGKITQNKWTEDQAAQKRLWHWTAEEVRKAGY